MTTWSSKESYKGKAYPAEGIPYTRVSSLVEAWIVWGKKEQGLHVWCVVLGVGERGVGTNKIAKALRFKVPECISFPRLCWVLCAQWNHCGWVPQAASPIILTQGTLEKNLKCRRPLQNKTKQHKTQYTHVVQKVGRKENPKNMEEIPFP